MQILYNKYKNILKLNKDIINKYTDLFRRSDADYNIYIDKNIFTTRESYNKVLHDMNKISYNILIKVRDIISTYPECFCPINNISEKNLQDILININKLFKETPSNKIPDLQIIENFIGISFNDKYYFTESSTPTSKENTHQINIANKNTKPRSQVHFQSNTEDFIKQGKVPSQKHDFIIKIGKNNNEQLRRKLINLKQINNKSIYYSFNETNSFVANNNKLSIFYLHRLKINTTLYYKTKDNKLGFFNCPSELIDISIANFDDWKIQNVDFTKYFKKYNYNNKVLFYSYTIYGILLDLINVLSEAPFPWYTFKYEKRIVRIIIFLFFYIINNFKDVLNIINTLSFDFNSIKLVTDNNIVDTDNNIVIDYNKYKDDKLIKHLFDFLLNTRNKIVNDKTDNKESLKIEFDNFINKLLEITFFSQEPDFKNDTNEQNGENITMLQKYLKYKSKYIKLLTKLGHN